ncbi:MAG: hypothetical protein GX286_02195 [Clostridiales bacterium]|jgi:hypothetical protein|nr:hypothetical protein [Clostridiales bacterium]
MKRDKWKDFEMSGKIEDYLSYKGLSLYGYNDSESGMINADNRQGNSDQRTHSGGNKQVY